MNENLFRTQFNQMETTEKQALMESLAARYDMTFLGLHTFDRWGQSSTTGIFEKDGREYVFVPGDTVTLGWERFAVGLDQDRDVYKRQEYRTLFPAPVTWKGWWEDEDSGEVLEHGDFLVDAWQPEGRPKYTRQWLQQEFAAGRKRELCLFWGHQLSEDGQLTKS